jgi:hypothetical protein
VGVIFFVPPTSTLPLAQCVPDPSRGVKGQGGVAEVGNGLDPGGDLYLLSLHAI